MYNLPTAPLSEERFEWLFGQIRASREAVITGFGQDSDVEVLTLAEKMLSIFESPSDQYRK